MTTTEKREELIVKAQKIWANVGAGASEQDMANAERAFMRLVAKHNLDEDEQRRAKTGPEEAVLVDVTKVYGKYDETWRMNCYSVAARMFMCHYFFRRLKNNMQGAVQHNIIGEPHNVAVAVEMGAYFEASINRLGNEGARLNPDAKTSHTARHRYIRTFRLSAIDRVSARVTEYLEALKKGGVANDDGTQLPALQSLFDRSQLLYDGWLEQQGMKVRSVEPKDKRLSRAGRSDGREAGNRVSLNTQVGEGSKKYALGNG